MENLSRGSLVSKSVLVAIIMVGSVQLLAGCQSWDRLRAGERVSPFIERTNAAGGGYSVDPLHDGRTVRDLRLVDPQPVNLDTLKLPGATNGPNSAYELATNDKVYRNRLQDYLLSRSEEVCLVHKADILAVSSTINGTFSAITSVAGGVGAIVTGAQAARILAGVAGITNGLRDDLNQNVFYNNVANAINRQIDSQRKKKLQDLEPKRAMEPDAYSVEGAVRDVIEYHDLCSFSEALAALSTEGSRPATADEIRGRLEGLRNQYERSNHILTLQRTAARESPSAEAQRSMAVLEETNTSIFQMMRSLTLQLALVENVPVSAGSSRTAPQGQPSTGKGTDGPISPTDLPQKKDTKPEDATEQKK